MRRDITTRLGEVQKQVERWRRQGGGRGKRLPQELWDAAVDVARVEGAYATSQALRMNYGNLKERMSGSSSKERSEETSPPVFIELERGSFGSRQVDRTVVELEGKRGGRMRIDVTGTSRLDIVGLAQAFWRCES